MLPTADSAKNGSTGGSIKLGAGDGGETAALPEQVNLPGEETAQQSTVEPPDAGSSSEEQNRSREHQDMGVDEEMETESANGGLPAYGSAGGSIKLGAGDGGETAALPEQVNLPGEETAQQSTVEPPDAGSSSEEQNRSREHQDMGVDEEIETESANGGLPAYGSALHCREGCDHSIASFIEYLSEIVVEQMLGMRVSSQVPEHWNNTPKRSMIPDEENPTISKKPRVEEPDTSSDSDSDD